MIHILTEVPGDAAAIDAIHRAAFAPSAVETGIVQALRADAALTVSLVADEDTHLVGHVAASPVTLEVGEEGWYGIGPIGVLPEFQGRGIGEQLMRAALEALKNLHGARGAVLLGDPGYYARFGFTESALTYEGFPLQALLLHPTEEADALPAGAVTYHPSFH